MRHLLNRGKSTHQQQCCGTRVKLGGRRLTIQAAILPSSMDEKLVQFRRAMVSWSSSSSHKRSHLEIYNILEIDRVELNSQRTLNPQRTHLVIGPDRAKQITNGFRTAFPISPHLPCRKHVKDDIITKLNELNFTRKEQNVILERLGIVQKYNSNHITN